MKQIIFTLVGLLSMSAYGQVFDGAGDQKFNLGVDFQSGATGMMATYDYGIGENMSIGLTAAYALGLDDDIDADFDERSMLRARFNANIGNVINLDPNFDIFPGLGFSTKNFGGHLGMRYFFTNGFGVYAEGMVPFAKYKTEDLTPAEEIYNQFNATIGMSFNF